MAATSTGFGVTEGGIVVPPHPINAGATIANITILNFMILRRVSVLPRLHLGGELVLLVKNLGRHHVLVFFVLGKIQSRLATLPACFFATVNFHFFNPP